MFKLCFNSSVISKGGCRTLMNKTGQKRKVCRNITQSQVHKGHMNQAKTSPKQPTHDVFKMKSQHRSGIAILRCMDLKNYTCILLKETNISNNYLVHKKYFTLRLFLRRFVELMSKYLLFTSPLVCNKQIR